MEAVKLQIVCVLVGAGGYDGFSPPLSTQGVGAGAEQDAQAVFLWDPLQEAPEGPVALILVASAGVGHWLCAGQHVF